MQKTYNFKGLTINGKELNYSNFKGKVLQFVYSANKLKKRINRKLIPFKLALSHRGTFSQKLKFLHFAKMAERHNVVAFRILRLAEEYTEDWYGVNQVSPSDKEWLCERGYAPRKVGWYGLTKKNYTNYLSDYVFYRADTYMDHSFLQLFEHKLNTYLMLAPFKEYMPIHYFYKRKEAYLPIGGIKIPYEGIMGLLREKPLAAKSCRGGHGRGFYKFHFDMGDYYINNIKVTVDEIEKTLEKLDDYIFTEYVEPHHIFKEICGPDAFPPAIRCITIYDKTDGPQFTSSIIRLGSSEGGLVTDYHGTIYCGIKIDTGEMFKPIWRENDLVFNPITVHPDTKVTLDGIIIPNWQYLKELILQISAYLPWTPYLVTDIIPTENGFKILEINSHGQARNCEAHYPFCLNKYQKRQFKIQ